MTEYDLAVVGILWGSTLAFALAAVTMVDSGRKNLLIVLWAIAGAFLVSAIAWPWLAEQWPALKAATENVAANKVAINILGTAIFCLFVLDFWLRSKRHRALAGGPHYSESELLQLARQTSEIRGKLDAFSSVHSASTIAADDLLNDVKDRLTKVENNPAKVALDPQTGRDILLLMHFAVYQSTVLMLDNLLEAAPEALPEWPLEAGGDFSSATEFVDLVRRKLDPGSWRRADFEGVMRNAEGIAEHTLEETPIDQRPDGIDHLALRKWAIARLQCNRAVIFLKGQKQEAEENLRSQRTNLLQRYVEKNKS